MKTPALGYGPNGARKHRFRAHGMPDTASIVRVLRTVAALAKVKGSDFTGHSRHRSVCQARHLAVATVAAEFPGLVLEQIGEIFHRTHATMTSCIHAHERLLVADPAYRALHARLQETLHPTGD